MICPTTANALYSYSDRFYINYAALTVNKYGNGLAYYVGTGANAGVLSFDCL
ncbi:beta-galactosidase trimerization domain-containing protein [Peribacillus muralis]|uniref:beta-galactosidase trimerization domain-containing protein n=1 Tax=Peribacillus muralis TaxID=264697 RepID=UPI0009F2605C